MDSTAVYQAALEALPLIALRVLCWILVGFAVAFACGVAGFLAAMGFDCWHRSLVRPVR